jgi:hypothetical protein
MIDYSCLDELLGERYNWFEETGDGKISKSHNQQTKYREEEIRVEGHVIRKSELDTVYNSNDRTY